MSDIDNTNIRLLDGALIQVFLGLMRHRKSTVVAEGMGLTQPAISHALKRLRAIYGDALFIRRPHGFEPTHVARELEPQLRSVVAMLERGLQAQKPFDPTGSTRTIRIAAYDYELATVLPPLIAQTARKSPSLQIATRPARGDSALAALSEGEVDLVLSYYEAPPDRFSVTLLYEDSYKLVARKDHPIERKGLSPSRYAAARHLLVSPDGQMRGHVDDVLQGLGLSRTASAAVPLFFPALAILRDSDLVATLPARVAERYAETFGLTAHDLPFPTQSISVSAVRHRRDENNPMHEWLIAMLRQIS